MIRTLLPHALLFLGCASTIVREGSVYRAEVTWFTQAATEQATLIEHFIQKHCTCTDGKFDAPVCEKAAKTALTAMVRAPWHKAMGLHNAGLADTRPPETPPIIPEPSTLCPGGE